jgi:6-phosphogluconate dehydrogenase
VTQQAHDLGLIGLGVMGQNLALNIVSKDLTVAVFDRQPSAVVACLARIPEADVCRGAQDLPALVAALKRPRKLMLMVQAGAAVDAVLDGLVPHLAAGDIVIDGGNSYFEDTRRRSDRLQALGLHFVGMGVSGGEEGALRGPSLMPGGSAQAYAAIEPVFARIAAKVGTQPCISHVGPDGAGHYVKMVHNGIEYCDMQLIAESYHLLRQAAGLDVAQTQAVFAQWQQGPLDSYLIEITRDILKVQDPLSGQPLVEMILDKAAQKGTGKWTSQSALDLGVATPAITEAVYARCLSAVKDERVHASTVLPGPSGSWEGSADELIAALHEALYASKICSYAQGFALMRAASQHYAWNLNFGALALLWRGGCIIRARFLDKIHEAFERQPDLPNLMLDPFFLSVLRNAQIAWRKVLVVARQCGIPTPSMNACLDYYDAYRHAVLPANLIQAQRDYFGAHTYERVDQSGHFHTDWLAH